MSRVAFVDGRYGPHATARVSIEDRGFQFADGVYEVWAVLDGRLVDAEGHFQRLDRSLAEMRIDPPLTRPALRVALGETLRRNRVRDGLLYLQITRGAAPRDHGFPPASTSPTIVITARRIDSAGLDRTAGVGVSIVTVPETRWARCDIKSVALLPNVLAKQAAREAGAAEAWFVDADGLVTEGASTSAWIVDEHGVLRTRDLAANILPGVTRNSILNLAADLGTPCALRAFTVPEAQRAREAFYTAASAFVTPVIRIDGAMVGAGRPGPVASLMRGLYLERGQSPRR